MQEQLSDRLRNSEVVIHETTPLRSGEIVNFYVDIKKAYGDPELLNEMAKATLENLSPRTTCLAAAGHGGLPLATAVSLLSGISLTLVRDKEKGHGRTSLIDGYVPSAEDAVTIVDDVFTTGSSLQETATTVQSTGAKIIGCHVIVARQDPVQFSYPVSHLFTPEDILQE